MAESSATSRSTDPSPPPRPSGGAGAAGSIPCLSAETTAATEAAFFDVADGLRSMGAGFGSKGRPCAAAGCSCFLASLRCARAASQPSLVPSSGTGFAEAIAAAKSSMVAARMFREAQVSRWTEMILGIRDEHLYAASFRQMPRSVRKTSAPGDATASALSSASSSADAPSKQYGKACLHSATPTIGTPASIAVRISRMQYGRVSTDCDCTRMRTSESRTCCSRSERSRRSSLSRKHRRSSLRSSSVCRKRDSMDVSAFM